MLYEYCSVMILLYDFRFLCTLIMYARQMRGRSNLLAKLPRDVNEMRRLMTHRERSSS